MKRAKQYFAYLLVAAIHLSCANAFQEMADKTTDKAKFYDAKLRLDRSDWSGAITVLNSLSTDFAAKREVKAVLASAYAGRCGLDFIDLSNKIQNAGATAFFSVLLSAFAGKTAANLTDCISAETTLNSISSTVAGRNANENLLMAFVAMAKMGVILAIKADTDLDGIVDPTFRPCHSDGVTGTAQLPNGPTAPYDDASELVTGLSSFMLSLAAVGSGDAGGTTFDEIQAFCDLLAAAPYNTDICSTTDRTAVTATQRRAIRAALSDNTGFGFSIDNDPGGVDLSCDLATCFTAACATY
jgi:hypothetical protein